ncbi:hypothetical protein F2Q70_00025854 [Brassica cretica]|uniref:Uncharacterized protein n=1 Tax=Brassica cretica TaxID=69181 RepID=A0A8S9LHH3_BRACR|nr:hypothetical protein F2Q70_00025854 [Brassica cretica]
MIDTPKMNMVARLGYGIVCVMSPFLELDIGSIRFNRNGTALVQIMGIDREQAVIK